MSTSQNQDTGQFIGIAILAVIALLLFQIALLVASAAVIIYALFLLMFVNIRYKIIGGVIAVICFFLSRPLLEAGIVKIKRKYNPDFLDDLGVLFLETAMYAAPALAFILTVFAIDFLNDQRGSPKLEADWIAWRRRWGFTKGLEEETPDQHRDEKPSRGFDVPPQDEQ